MSNIILFNDMFVNLDLIPFIHNASMGFILKLNLVEDGFFIPKSSEAYVAIQEYLKRKRIVLVTDERGNPPKITLSVKLDSEHGTSSSKKRVSKKRASKNPKDVRRGWSPGWIPGVFPC